MIAADIRIVDLEPHGFSWLNDVLLRRQISTEPRLSVLHDGSRVLQVAGAAAGAAIAPGDRVGDVEQLADRLLTDTGAGEVVLLDATLLGDLSADVTDIARDSRSQGELLWRARERWNSHPAVVLRPRPVLSRWLPVEALLAHLPDHHWIVVEIAMPAGDPFLLAGRMRGGLIVELTSRRPDGPVAARLGVTQEQAELVLGAADPLLELAKLIDNDAVEHHGLEALHGGTR